MRTPNEGLRLNPGLDPAVFWLFSKRRRIVQQVAAMNAPVRQRGLGRLTQPLPPRTTALILGGLALAAVVGGGGWWLYQRFAETHRTPAQARALIRKFLYKQTGQKQFRTEAAAALLTDADIWVPPPPTVTNITTLITNLVGGTNRITPQTIRKILRPAPTPADQIKRRLQQQVNEAMDYPSVFRIIGEYLWVTEQLLAEPDPSRHGTGVQVAVEVGRVALNEACSPWLAARICEAYVWPELAFAETNQARLDLDMLMDLPRQAFREAGETNNLIRNYRLLIEKAPQSARADRARIELGALLETQGRLAEALELYKAVRSKSSRLQLRIANLEGRLQRKAKPQAPKRTAASKTNSAASAQP